MYIIYIYYKRWYIYIYILYIIILSEYELNCKDHINNIAVKLNRANAFLFNIRNFLKKPSTLQYLIHILIMPIWFGLRIQMLWVEFLYYKRRLRELLISSRIAIQVLYFRTLNYLNSMIKSSLKMCFWSVNLSIVSCHQPSPIASLFDPIFTIMRQRQPPLVIF